VVHPSGRWYRPTHALPGCTVAAGHAPAFTGSCRGLNPPVVIGTATYGTCF